MPRKLVIKGKSIRRLNVTASSTQAIDEAQFDDATGRVIDGYVRNSDVKIYGPDGALLGQGVSQPDGTFNIPIERITSGVVSIVCTGGVDISTEKPFAGELKTLTVKEEGVEEIAAVVTPITTLVAGVIEASDEDQAVSAEVIQQAKTSVATSLDIQVDTIETDFIQTKNIKVAKRSSQVATITKLAQQEISKSTSRTTASESVRKAIAKSLIESETFDLAESTSIEQVLTEAAHEAAEITQDVSVIAAVAETAQEVANSIQVVTDTIEQINEDTTGDDPTDPDAAIEAVALIGSVVDSIVNDNVDITAVDDQDALVDLVEQAQVFQVQAPVAVPPAVTIYPWTTTPHPILDEDIAICLGGLYITVDSLTDWKCTAGQFEPFSLASGVLKRLNNSVAGATQPINLQQGDWLALIVDGLSRATFVGGSIQWSDGSTESSRTVTGTQVFTCIDSPTDIVIEMIDDVDELNSIRCVSSSTGQDAIANGNFTSMNSKYYELNGWHLDQEDPVAVDPYAIGVITGFLEEMKYTMFYDPVVPINDESDENDTAG